MSALESPVPQGGDGYPPQVVQSEDMIKMMSFVCVYVCMCVCVCALGSPGLRVQDMREFDFSSFNLPKIPTRNVRSSLILPTANPDIALNQGG